MKIENEVLIVSEQKKETIIQTITDEDKYKALLDYGIKPYIAEGMIKGLWYVNTQLSYKGSTSV